jgi:hypothetical protein
MTNARDRTFVPPDIHRTTLPRLRSLTAFPGRAIWSTFTLIS